MKAFDLQLAVGYVQTSRQKFIAFLKAAQDQVKTELEALNATMFAGHDGMQKALQHDPPSAWDRYYSDMLQSSHKRNNKYETHKNDRVSEGKLTQ